MHFPRLRRLRCPPSFIGRCSGVNFYNPPWSILLAAFVLRERIRLDRTIATIVGFAGVIIVVQPQGGIELACRGTSCRYPRFLCNHDNETPDKN